MHVHTDAINALAFGAKKWFLLPPDQAEYSIIPPSEWTSVSDAVPPGVAGGRPLMCTQQAGDLLYVPRAWGHATLNLQQSVGVAIEFNNLPGW